MNTPFAAEGTIYYGDLFTLTDEVQTLANAGKSGYLEIQTEGQPSYLFFDEGQLIDAVHGERRGTDAVFSLLKLPKTTTTYTQDYKHPYRTIEQPTIALLIEAARRADEANQRPPRENEAAVPALQIFAGYQTARHFPLERQLLKIGRSMDNDIVIADPSVSRYHARLEVHDFGVILRDLGSRNGTWLMSHRICDVVLQPDDSLHFGLVSARYVHRAFVELGWEPASAPEVVAAGAKKPTKTLDDFAGQPDEESPAYPPQADAYWGRTAAA
ncbi:MAG: FHA domain-containing protein [Verrucomicrobiae bacterium]|nr:FHA domain-containing protein [Verrucomicrobiae bacterium]